MIMQCKKRWSEIKEKGGRGKGKRMNTRKEERGKMKMK